MKRILLTILLLTVPAVQAQEGGPNNQHIPRIRTGNDDGKGFRIVSEDEARRLVSIPSRPALCRICRHKVDIPMPQKKDGKRKSWQLSSRDTDADLCPHPTGKIRFHAEIPICLHCGFAAYQADFVKSQTPVIKSWVRKVLTPNMHRAEQQLLGVGGNLQMTRASFVDLFKQEDIPDVVRCHHALSYYITKKAPVELRAKLAWITAWAYRRELSGSVDGPYMMPSIQRVLKAIESRRTGGNAPDMEQRINTLAEMFEKKNPDGKFYYPCIDRQSIRILLAGAYSRVGLPTWARICLAQVAKSARNRGGNSPEDDPWLETTTGRSGSKKKEADAICKVIERIANVRLSQLDREQSFLSMAATLLREALRQGVYSSTPEAIPSRMYLIGEFERRQEKFLAAKLWLEAAKNLTGDNPGVELNAPGQLVVMNDYASRLGLKEFPADPRVATDRQLVDALVRQVQASRMLKQMKGKPEQIQTGGP